MRKSIQMVFVISTFLFCLNVTADAQGSGATNVYRTQFLEMRGKVKSIFDRVEQTGKVGTNRAAKDELQEEIFATTKLIHRLQEEALRSNLDSLKKGNDSNNVLLLVSKGCTALDFVLSSLSDYIDTDDRVFLSLARDGDTLIKSVEKTL